MPCAATQTGLWCPLGLNVLQARNPDSNAPIQRLATMRLPWRQNTLRFLPIDAQAPGLLGHICRSISSRTHKHAGKRRAAIMNKTSADATRLTAPPALHWARDSRAHYHRRHGPTSTFYQFFFLVGIIEYLPSSKIGLTGFWQRQPAVSRQSAVPRRAPKCWSLST